MCRCDHLPLCSSVTLQASAADQEIMKSQTHCALCCVKAQFSSMLTILPISTGCLFIVQIVKTHQPLETSHNVSLIALYSVWPCPGSTSKTQQCMNRLGVEPQLCIQTLTVTRCSQSDQWLLMAVQSEVQLCHKCRRQGVYCGTPLPVLLTT